jgi:predicted glycoside hydrolase/deacetylase ChbG (UPF0249 family)
MRIILNADDFGMDQDTVDATIECFQRGALSSATIMPRMPATAKAVEFALKHPEFSFGIHLTYVTDTVEAPLSDPAAIPALVTPDGKFLESQTLRLLALRNRIPLDQIEAETAAQLSFLRDQGLSLSHVDSHGHLHKFRPFVRVLKRLLPRFGIKRVRSAQDTYLRRPLTSPTFWIGPFWRRRIMRNFLTTDHFFMPGSMNDARAMESWMPDESDASIEIGCHPGYSEPWRNAERQAIQSFAVRAPQSGHRIITWNQI